MKIRLRATAAQQEILNHPARIKVLVAGRRWGKSTTLELLFAKTGLSRPRCASEIICPKYSHSRKIYDEMRMSPGFSKFIVRDPLQPHPHFELFNGHMVGFRSFENPDSVRGGGLVLAATDESSDLNKADVMKVIWPKLSDQGGTLFITGTLKGVNGWLWQMYLRGQEKNQSLIKSWLFPTHTNLVRYGGAAGKQRLAEDRAAVSDETWRQEYMCEPAATQAGVFTSFQKLCILKAEAERSERPRPDRAYCAGLDLGRARDFTAINVIEYDPTAKTGVVVHSEKFNSANPYEIIAQQAGAVCRFWNNCACVIDVTGNANPGRRIADSLYNLFAQHIVNPIPFEWNATNKTRVIDTLVIATEKPSISVYPDMTELINEMNTYERIYVGDGRVRYGAPAGLHDDHVAAFAQAWLGCVNEWYTSVVGVPVTTAF